jgi:hypothetical protein
MLETDPNLVVIATLKLFQSQILLRMSFISLHFKQVILTRSKWHTIIYDANNEESISRNRFSKIRVAIFVRH